MLYSDCTVVELWQAAVNVSVAAPDEKAADLCIDCSCLDSLAQSDGHPLHPDVLRSSPTMFRRCAQVLT